MILIVDDDLTVTVSLAMMLKQAGYQSLTVHTPGDALREVLNEEIRLVLQDMNFSRRTTGEEGLKLLKDLKRLRPDLPVVLITAWGTIQLAVEGMRAGAADFITKPWTPPQLLQAVGTSLSLAEAQSGHQDISSMTRQELDSRYDLGSIVGEDPKMLKLFDVIGRVSATDASVLITGESGTGKELIAEVIHANSHRRNSPFIKVNLGGISASLFESEMFGHVRGAFTDAHMSRKGRFETAAGGTIFLDEVGDLDSGSQVKLLRVLQDRTFEVLGSSQTRTVDVRVVSATNRNLSRLVDQGLFREDLLYRLNLIALHLPPLRERVDDIPFLVDHFLRKTAAMYGFEHLSVQARAVRWLQSRAWPGNIRELSQVIERTVLVSNKEHLDTDDFERALEMETREGRGQSLPDIGVMSLDEIEKAMIAKALAHHDGHITRAAASLGLSRAALYRRLEKHGIKP